MSSRLAMYARFVAGMPAFLRQRITPESARATIAERLRSRERNFLDLVDRGVFANPASPYVFLFRAAGCEHGDIRRLVVNEGVDAALTELLHAGVSVSYDEFKGRAPITRGGRTFGGNSAAFDNPLATRHLEGQTSGSSGTPTRVGSDLAHVASQIPMLIATYEANGLVDAPVIVYRPGLPSVVATNNILRQIVAGNPVRRWFSPISSAETGSPMRFRLAGAATPVLIRLCGSPFPEQEVVPLTNAIVVARAAGALAQAEGKCLVRCSVSTALTVSIAASDARVGLTGVTFTGAGEPPSPAKVRGISASGARYLSTYSMTEAGPVAAGCAHGTDATDVHLMRDRFGMLKGDEQVDPSDDTVGPFFLTTLLATAPKIMINVSTDDFGILETRSCGCLLDGLGLSQHVRRIRSVSKMTGRGITLVASDITHIIEEVLPARFGGTSQDYQLIEEENESGATQLYLLVSPSVALDDERLPPIVLLEALSRGSPGASFGGAVLRSHDAVSVRRQKPQPGATGKLPPFRAVSVS